MITFELVTLAGTKFSEEVHELLLPTPQGEIGVFRHHMPLVSIASPGVIKIRKKPNHPDDMLEIFATNGGVIEVMDNRVRMLVDEADNAAEISEQEAKRAHDDALKLRAEAKDQVSLEKAQTMLDRSAVRLKVAELKRHKPRSRSST